MPGFNVRSLAWIAAAGLAALSSPPAIAGNGDVAIQYQLLTSFAGAEKANGRIIVSVTNLTGRSLSDVTLRLADQSRGRITGPVQENLTLAAGETRKVEGDFVLDVAALDPHNGLEWIVVFSDAEGFAHQTMVRADATLAATMDADAASSTRPRP